MCRHILKSHMTMVRGASMHALLSVRRDPAGGGQPAGLEAALASVGMARTPSAVFSRTAFDTHPERHG